MSKVNVINNVGKEVVVTVNEVNGNTQIVINLADSKAELSTLKPGDVFKVNDVEYIVLEQSGDTTAVLRKELLEDDMKFGSNNNWKESDIRKYLNNEYLKEIEEVFGKENIFEHSVDLLSMDGLEDYGTCRDKVSLLTIDQYRKYRRRKLLRENKEKCWWLSTPDSTPSGYSTDGVRFVFSVGDVGYGWYDGCGAVRPFFILSSSIFISCDNVNP